MDNETITNMTLHGSTLYNATNISILLTMNRDEYLLALMGPRKQENEVISVKRKLIFVFVFLDDYQNKIVNCFVLAKSFK